MFSTRRRSSVPPLNTTSTADISFMLLIFFLVTSSMDADKGLPRQLPPPQQETTAHDVARSHVLSVALDARDRLTCDGDTVSPAQLTARAMDFVSHDPAQHVIAIQTDRETTFGAYFQMQDALAAAYNTLRRRAASQQYGRPWKQLTTAERNRIVEQLPLRISEQQPQHSDTQEGGRP